MVHLSVALAFVATAGSVAGQTYAPSFVACPPAASPLLRLSGTVAQGNQSLSAAESAYVAGRKALLPAALKTYLGGLSSTVYGGNLSAATIADLPTIALSISGGGNRAALYGAGVLAALDGREPGSVAAGTGGLLQSATYISALSGGSWMLSSFVQHNFPRIKDMVLGNPAQNTQGWNLALDLFTPGNSTIDPTQQTNFTNNIFADLTAKRANGFPVTFGDYWARALSYHFLPNTTVQNFFNNATPNHGAGITFSGATKLSSYIDHTLPYPLIVADAYSVNSNGPTVFMSDVPLTQTVYEMSPLEFGSYDIAAFLPMASLGTQMRNGVPINGPTNATNCVTNFDNAGFILGISSNLFNLYNRTHSAVWDNVLSPVNVAWQRVNTTYMSIQPDQQLDISAFPNPFMGIGAGSYEDTNEQQLRLIDGGLDGEVDPIPPLAVPARKVDIMIVAASSADQMNRPDGTSMVATALRMSYLPAGADNLPPLPLSNTTYVQQGLNVRPTFFGCKGTPANLSGKAVASPYPIIVYLPNFDPSGVTNTSTGQLVYPLSQASLFLSTATNNTYKGFLNSTGGADPLWPTALACAVVERTRGRTAVDRTPACVSLFTKYCWSGIEAVLVSATSTTSAGTGTVSSTSSPRVSTISGSVVSTVTPVSTIQASTTPVVSRSTVAGGGLAGAAGTSLVLNTVTAVGTVAPSATVASSGAEKKQVGGIVVAALAMVMVVV